MKKLNQKMDYRNLFQDTEYDKFIINDLVDQITLVRKAYPQLLETTRQCDGDEKIIVLSGTVPVKMWKVKFYLPVECSIPSDYPEASPAFSIVYPKGAQIRVVEQFINPDGTLKLENYQWNKYSSIYTFIKWVINQLEQYPPLSPSGVKMLEPVDQPPNAPEAKNPRQPAGRRPAADPKMAMRNNIVKSVVSEVLDQVRQAEESTAAIREARLFDNYLEILQSTQMDVQTECNEAEREVSNASVFEVSHDLESGCSLEAEFCVSREAVSILREAYTSNMVSLEEYIKMLRSYGNSHFENYVFPQLVDDFNRPE